MYFFHASGFYLGPEFLATASIPTVLLFYFKVLLTMVLLFLLQALTYLWSYSSYYKLLPTYGPTLLLHALTYGPTLLLQALTYGPTLLNTALSHLQ
jgi:hypothetical protein